MSQPSPQTNPPAAKMVKDDVIFAIIGKALGFVGWLSKSLHADLGKKKKKDGLCLSFSLLGQQNLLVS